MKYQFDITLIVPKLVEAETEEKAEERAKKWAESIIAGSALEKEYPDVAYSWNKPFLDGTCTFHAQIEAWTLEEAKENILASVEEMLRGSELASLEHFVKHQLSDEQPGLDEILDDIDEDAPFAIAADASMWHIECAKDRYGEEEVDLAIEMAERYSEETIISSSNLFAKYPKDREGNLLHVVWGRDHIQSVRNAWVYEEEVLDSCDCLNRLYDEPRKERKV